MNIGPLIDEQGMAKVEEHVADAIAKAKTLAEAAGVSLGNVLEISEPNPIAPPMPMAQAKFRADAAMQEQ